MEDPVDIPGLRYSLHCCENICHFETHLPTLITIRRRPSLAASRHETVQWGYSRCTKDETADRSHRT